MKMIRKLDAFICWDCLAIGFWFYTKPCRFFTLAFGPFYIQLVSFSLPDHEEKGENNEPT